MEQAANFVDFGNFLFPDNSPEQGSRGKAFVKDAIHWLLGADCAGRVSARRSVMLQELRAPVEVEGEIILPLQQVLLL